MTIKQYAIRVPVFMSIIHGGEEEPRHPLEPKKGEEVERSIVFHVWSYSPTDALYNVGVSLLESGSTAPQMVGVLVK